MSEDECPVFFLDWNKELFENAPPYMIIRPYLKEGLYISSRQISKLIIKLTYIHVQPLTKPHEYYDKYVSYTLPSLHKSIWTRGQIWMKLVTNTHRDYSKSTGISWQLWMTLVTNKHVDDSKSEWYSWQIHIKMIANIQELVFICYTIDL